MSAGPSRWSLAPRLLFRMAGFPFDLLEPLASPDVARRLDALLGAGLSGAVLTAALEELQPAFDREVEAATTHLRAVASTPKLKEAVFLSNPASFPGLEKWMDEGERLRGAKERQGTLALVTYLQRFCAKNDSTSFFGPFFWGHLRLEPSEALSIDPGPEPKLHRVATLTFWAVDALARWVSTFPEAAPLIRPRRCPTVLVEGCRVRGLVANRGPWAPGRELEPLEQVELTQLEAVLWRLADGARSLPDVLASAERETGETEAVGLEQLQRLARIGLLELRLEVPVGLFEPLSHLVDCLEAAANPPPAWQACRQLIELQHELPQGDLEVRRRTLARMGEIFEQACGEPPLRSGQFYADRTLVHENATRSFERLELGGPILQRLADLSDVLDLLWRSTEAEQATIERGVGAWLEARFPGRARIPLVDYAAAFLEDRAALMAIFDRAAEELREMDLALYRSWVPEERAAEERVEVSREALWQQRERLPSAGPRGVVLNPDILLSASSLEALHEGHFKLVLGEVQVSHDKLTQSPAALFLEAPERAELRDFVRRRYLDALDPGEEGIDVCRGHANKTFAQVDLGFRHLELAGRSPLPRDRVLTPAELEVGLMGGRPTLHHPGSDRLLRVLSLRASERRGFLRPFALPPRDGAITLPASLRYSPRVEVCGIVVVRRFWRFEASELLESLGGEAPSGWSLELFARVRMLRRRWQLPRWLFARIEGEKKPLCLDLDNYLLLHAFHRKLVKRSGRVSLSEMVPGPNELWLRDAEGRYTCEARLGLYRAREPR
jgi:hypothetical protein